MRLLCLTCPKCGASLEEDSNRMFCPYCGAKLILDKEEQNINVKVDLGLPKLSKKKNTPNSVDEKIQKIIDDMKYDNVSTKYNKMKKLYYKYPNSTTVCTEYLFALASYYNQNYIHFNQYEFFEVLRRSNVSDKQREEMTQLGNKLQSLKEESDEKDIVIFFCILIAGILGLFLLFSILK